MKMLHVTIHTNQFYYERRFYQDFIGLRTLREVHSTGNNIVFLANSEGETEIEIIENPEANDAGNEYLSIGFNVDNVYRTHKMFTDFGVEVTPIFSPAQNVQFFFVIDPAGVKVQFVQKV